MTTLVAVGDSIANALDSWTRVLAEHAGWESVNLAAGGASSRGVLTQLPDAPTCDVGAVSVGTNDILTRWNPERFAGNVDAILAAMSERCATVLVTTIPRELSRLPGAPRDRRERIAAANAAITAAAGRRGARVVPADDLAGREWLIWDRIHPTNRGQTLIAQRAAELLGLPPVPLAVLQHIPPRRYVTGMAGSSLRAMARVAAARVRPA